MKILKLLGFILLAASIQVQAQESNDSTSAQKKYKTGFAVYLEYGVLSNSSFSGIRDQMKAMNIKPFENVMSSIVLGRRTETEKFMMESRLILMNSTKYDRDRDGAWGQFRGIGIGADASPKFVNTKRWNVLIPLGWDLMLYQTAVRNNQSANFGQVLQNPNNYKAMKLYNGSFNLHGGVGVDYKMNLFPKVYDQVYLSAKASYHLPVFRRGKWKSDDVTINDLPSFKANQLYAQLGLVFISKRSRSFGKKMGCNH